MGLPAGLWGGRVSNPRPTDYESLPRASATRRNGSLKQLKSPARQHFWSLPVRSRYASGTASNRPRTPRSRRDEMGWQAFANQATHADTPAHARADVPSTLTSDEAADQPVPAVRLATERRESDGRFARR